MLGCLFGLHRRSGRSIRFHDGRYTARCRNCTVTLERDDAGRWAPIAAPDGTVVKAGA